LKLWLLNLLWFMDKVRCRRWKW